MCAVLDSNGETRGLVKSTRVNRTGDQDGITGRVLAAMRKTYSLARKRANDPSFLALPAKPAKPAPKPARKAPAKRASKRPSAKRINDAVKAAPKKAVSKPAFKVGMLVKSSPTMGSRTQPGSTPLRGMVKAINPGDIEVFWFDNGKTQRLGPTHIRPLVAE